MKQENLRMHLDRRQSKMSDEKTIQNEQKTEEILTEKEAKVVKKMFGEYLQSYKEKDPAMTDKEWLEDLFLREIPGISKEEASQDAEEIVESIETFDENLKSVNEAAKKGVSKENWLSDKIQEMSVGMSVQEFGHRLQGFDDILHVKNAELAEALTVATDGEVRRVNMNPNLDGILAENIIAKTTELSGFAQGKNIRVDVLQSNNANSVDVRAINLDTGKYQNYQLKFGKDAAHTIKYIEEGNYNNQQIIVPSEQLDDVRTHFKAKGSNKSISDHISIDGAEGKSFKKDELKELQKTAQEDGLLPKMDYSHYSTQDLTKAIGKNAGAMALQSAAITTGLTIASKVFSDEPVEADELVEVALKSGVDASVKAVTAGTLQVAIRKGVIKCIASNTPAGVIANIACVGIENIKVLGKVVTGELTVTKGLDQMGRTTTSMVAGLWAMAKGAAVGAKLTAWIPVVGPVLSVVTGFIGGMVGYFGGSKVGDAIYEVGKKVASSARTVAKAAWNGIKSAGRAVGDKLKSGVKAIAGIFSH